MLAFVKSWLLSCKSCKAQEVPVWGRFIASFGVSVRCRKCGAGNVLRGGFVNFAASFACHMGTLGLLVSPFFFGVSIVVAFIGMIAIRALFFIVPYSADDNDPLVFSRRFRAKLKKARSRGIDPNRI